jgi:uncharacterized protein
MNPEIEEEDVDRWLTEDALKNVPIFPLPNTVLLPGTFVSLHIFEPRYRKMIEDAGDTYRLLGLAMFDEDGDPDAEGRPAIYNIAGLGIIRRAAKLPDGRYNVVLEGVRRVALLEEMPPSEPYRRASVQILDDHYPASKVELEVACSAVRALGNQRLAGQNVSDTEIMREVNQIRDPGRLADIVAASTLTAGPDRQTILETLNVLERLQALAGMLGSAALLDESKTRRSNSSLGWGIPRGEA